MGACCSSPPPPPTPAPIGLVDLPSYDPSSSPFTPSIPDAIRHYQSTHPPCSLSSLLSQRDEFWHTRVEGDPQMWLVLRAAADADDDATREALMDSAGLQRWSIERMDAVYTYDAKGVRYDVPLYCIYLPHTLLTAEQEEAAAAAAASAAAGGGQGKGGGGGGGGGVGEEGKEVGVEGSPKESPAVGARSLDGERVVSFKVRFSDGMGDLPLSLPQSTELREVRRRVAEAKGIGEERQVYFLHGQRWVEGTLGQMGLKKEQVLQCFVKQLPADAEEVKQVTVSS